MTSARLRISILVAAASFAAGAAHAADYAPPQCYDPALIASGRAPYGAVPCYVPPPVVEEFSSWYLRGDIGFSNQQVKSLTNPTAAPPMVSSSYGFDAAPTFGLGIGYYFNDWLRLDLTGEYRGRANFHGSEIYSVNGGYATDEYTGSKSEWLFLLNGYVDLGTWYRATPYIGGGAGAAQLHVTDYASAGAPPFTGGLSRTQYNFAWAAMAGVGYAVAPNILIDVNYRYINFGDVTTAGDSFGAMTLTNLAAHEIRIGFRWCFDDLFMAF